MTGLTMQSLEKAILDIVNFVHEDGEPLTVKPTQLLIHPAALRDVRRILFPHRILKRRKGVRGRAMTLKWRRKL